MKSDPNFFIDSGIGTVEINVKSEPSCLYASSQDGRW